MVPHRNHLGRINLRRSFATLPAGTPPPPPTSRRTRIIQEHANVCDSVSPSSSSRNPFVLDCHTNTERVLRLDRSINKTSRGWVRLYPTHTSIAHSG